MRDATRVEGIYNRDINLDDKAKRILEMTVDLDGEDITSGFLEDVDVVAELKVKDRRLVRKTGILAGLEEVEYSMDYAAKKYGKKLEMKRLKRDGDEIRKNDVIIKVMGNCKAILLGERTALNIISRMSGIATQTHWIGRVAATRKSPLCLSHFDKRAVQIGGGYAHRKNLGDWVMIKDNHLKVLELGGMKKEDAIRYSIKKAKERGGIVEIEVKDMNEAIIAAKERPDIIMLDNFTPKEIEETCRCIRKRHTRVIIELSGGITPKNIAEYQKQGADVISMGSITNSAQAVDMNMKITRLA